MGSKQSLRTLFSIAFACVLLASILCSLATWGCSLMFLTNTDQFIKPANRFEKQIPQILSYVKQEGEKLLVPSAQPALEEHIPSSGIQYQVIDINGNLVYGWQKDRYIHSREEISAKLNKTDAINGKYVSYYPILDAEGNLKGLFLVRYSLSLITSNLDRPLFLFLFLFANLAAPFLYFVLFTLLFGKKLGARLNPPIQQMIEGAQRIQRYDLNFTLADVSGSRELSKLGAAFEEMRRALHASLTSQWSMEQERREMVSAIAHDLRTPLAIVQGHVENMIEGAVKPEQVPNYLQRIHSNTVRAVRLLQEMDEISKIDHPDFQLTFSKVDLLSFFKQKQMECLMLCQRKSIELTADIQLEPPLKQAHLCLDIHRLEQIIDNLMDNCIRFTPEGGTIRWDVNVNLNSLRFEIRDSGSGFSDKDLKQMFRKFYQGDAARSLHKGHSGLGLYIVKTLAEKHGGSIEAHNLTEGGAQFILRIKERAPA
ncbi:sensor histidine kinase [Brevibacillus sp. B_LB10_24]|uniref:sensor histidine kinase n=1 Tax=Brevibacillus sp. B_LB10_24 TaxID=3380645 RepID=UPI0038B7FA4E